MNNITKNYLQIVNILNSPEECNIEISKDNKYIIRIKKDNKLRYIGSKYSVEKDIQKLLYDIGRIDDNTIIIVFGLGAGEHIRNLLSNLSDTNKVFIVEPSSAVIKEVIKLDNYANLLRDDRLALCYTDNKIRKHLNEFIEEHNIDNIKIVVFANYNIIFDKEYELLINEVKIVRRNKKIGNNTLYRFSKLFFENFMKNMQNIDECRIINSFKGIFNNKPAIIVSAGPSLEKNINLLKDIQDKFVIICGARSFKPLIKIGVRPDFICAVDPQDVTYTIMEENLNCDIPLVFMEASNYKLVKEYNGPKIIFANQGMEQYLKEIINEEVDSLLQGGSVAHICMGLAVYLGCSTIIFVGQDLAYTDDKFHANVAKVMSNPGDAMVDFYEKNKQVWCDIKDENIFVNNIHGNPIRTSVILNSYREEFEELISECSNITFINSTEGGANINGTIILSLKDSIDKYGARKFSKCINDIIKNDKRIDKHNVTKNLIVVKHNINNIIKACEIGIKYASQLHDYYILNKKVNISKVLNELDKVDLIIGDIQKIGVIAYLLFNYIEGILKNEIYQEKSNETEEESGTRIAKRCIALYGNIIKASKEALEYLQCI